MCSSVISREWLTLHARSDGLVGIKEAILAALSSFVTY